MKAAAVTAEAGAVREEAVRDEAVRALEVAERVAATREDVESAETGTADSGREECPVCLIELAGRPKKACFPCGHVVCSPCADQHYAQFPTCPTCRLQIQHLLKLF